MKNILYLYIEQKDMKKNAWYGILMGVCDKNRYNSSVVT